jgi:phage shock protein A
MASCPPASNVREQRKVLDKELKQAEKNLAWLEKSIFDLNNKLIELNEKIAAGSSQDLNVIIKDLGSVQQKIDQAEAEWLVASEKREQAEKALQKL